MVHLRNGIGWVDATGGRCALPPDGETFAIAPGSGGVRCLTFYVVDAPDPVAVFSLDANDPLTAHERTVIEAVLLATHIEYVAYLGQQRAGAAVVEGKGKAVVLATAAAALKAIGGWDETVPISIEVRGKTIDVRLTYDGGEWTADVNANPA